ncbi:MAG: dihydropteroate synthase [Deltaproteobacteria bacterium]|nr:dihydropteroate synthase [Deltaproteobacteria bacterium]
MGVLNVTPDSFSDGGRHSSLDAAIDHALSMMDAGADLIDIGGESSRPGSDAVPLELELQRVVPVIEVLARRGIGPISIDTTKVEVARRALDAGAAILNDISGGTFEPPMLELAARAKAPLVLMHLRARPKAMQEGAWRYEGGVVAAVVRALAERIAAAESAGVDRGDIVVDPGIGFGKTTEENVELLAGLRELASLGCPILVGTSRKSFLGQLTGRQVNRREYATAASVALAISAGADLVRVHDVEAMGDVVRVADAIARRSCVGAARVLS